jgi:hypothetical protein
MTAQPPPTGRRGFYSQRFRSAELRDLEDQPGGLQEEIQLLRIIMRRALEETEESTDLKLQDWIRLLNAISGAAARLTTLIKTQRELSPGESDEITAALWQALDELGYGPDS